ncbi:hypothetical protein MCHIJ_12000 [Mycolicibacterium chitae]|nr:hypothetical protein MCHIJ_12000 [Mycolicibacterium chitae]
MESAPEGKDHQMINRPLTKLAIAGSAVALSLTAGAGVAAADPDFGPMINTTCTYDQALTALRTENPVAAEYLEQSPPNMQFLRTFTGSSPAERERLIQQVKGNPGADQAFPVIQQMFASCNKY